MLYIDQHGHKIWARTVADLCKQAGRAKASEMYLDKADGRTVHVGYIVGDSWFTAYVPYEGAA